MLRWFSLLLAVSLVACMAPVEEAPSAGVVDLGVVDDGKNDGGAKVRVVDIDVAPGKTKWFRVSSVRFSAELEQAGDVPAHLTAKHYDVFVEGETSTAPTIEAVAEQEMLRNWTLKVYNDGTEQLVGTLTISYIEELGTTPPTGGSDVIAERDVTVAAGDTKRFRIKGPSIRADLQQSTSEPAELSAKSYEIDVAGAVATNPYVTAESDTERNWTLRVKNLGTATLEGKLVVSLLTADTPDVPIDGRPTLDSAVQYSNEWCSYGDTAPYLESVNWEHPAIQKALTALVPGWRSTFAYTEWRVAYGLEKDSSTLSDSDRAIAKARNYIRVICGEHRDYPDMIAAKLAVIGDHTHAAGPEQLQNVDTTENLFDQLTYPAYVRLTNVMGTMHSYRSNSGALDGYHYGFGAYGHGSRRVDHSVAPFTHCEMRFVFANYLVDGAPTFFSAAQYEVDYTAYKANVCSADDLAYMYNFRGHVNFQPLWLESNAFIHNSRRARGAELSTGARDTYLRPFATRYNKAREAWATYLFYRDQDHADMIQASESGGGHVLYLTDQDSDGDGLADYRLFGQLGCGDQGVGLATPSSNCNMVGWTTAWNTATTTGHSASWDPELWGSPDMGFMQTFTSFEERMGRFNQALDRHTNWGPTGYYMLDASTEGDTSPRFYGAYSPIVAASYDVSASDFFVRRDYPSTHAYEQNRAKWLFVMRFPTASYYDEARMAAGDPIDFDSQYFNETSLSNDYYDERALDHWGYIEGAEMYAQVYLTYGHHGDQPPAPVTVPAP